MSAATNPLFTVEEALARVAQNKEQGCLLVTKGSDLIHIYVQNGFVIRAHSNGKEGEKAIEQALRLTDVSYTWLRGVQPPQPSKDLHLSIKELVVRHGSLAGKPTMMETSRLAPAPIEKKEPEAVFRYYLVPQDRLTERLYLSKTSTVMGRDPTADLVIDNNDVSWRHSLLDIQTRGVFILDLDSTNGTFVNGSLVRDAHLNPGDRIELGPCVFVLNREAMGAL